MLTALIVVVSLIVAFYVYAELQTAKAIPDNFLWLRKEVVDTNIVWSLQLRVEDGKCYVTSDVTEGPRRKVRAHLPFFTFIKMFAVGQEDFRAAVRRSGTSLLNCQVKTTSSKH